MAKQRTLRKERKGWNPVTVGVVAAILLVVVVYFAFTKAIPFTHDFRLNAVFTSANSIRPGSPVRIAGVNVGEVTGVKRKDGTNLAIVEMQIEDKGLPIHKDAQLKIRPRIFLEGNFFVDLKPGTPSAPTLGDNDTVAVTQTATPVQLDQVLTALQQPTREDLQSLLQNFGGALNDKPTAASDLTQDPAVRGKTGAEALNGSLNYSADAFKQSAIVNQAFLGQQPGDLTELVASLATVSAALDKNESALEGLVTNFNTTLAAFASQSTNLSTSIRLLGPTLANTQKALVSLNDSFPATRTFALELVPGVEQTQPTIDAAEPWIAQATPLLGKKELGGLLQDLQPATASLALVTATGVPVFQQGDLLSKCQTNVFLPAGDVKIQDGAFTTGKENYKEFAYGLVGLAGEGQGRDGNGQYVRFQTGGGSYPFTTLPYGTNPVGEKNYGNAVAPPQGTRPPYPNKLPPKVHDQPCYKQPVPDLNAAPVGPREGGSPGELPTSLGGPGTNVPAQRLTVTPMTGKAKVQ
jgi:phospholipid/cholesterol/gamma-HCH transport system substrate-binding protein